MGRTNMMLLGMGILACVVMSLLMKRGLKIQQSGKSDAVVRAVTEVFGSRLQGTPKFLIHSRRGQRVGVLVLIPRVSRNASRLVQNVGALIWQEHTDRFDSLEILHKRDEQDKGRRIPIPSPFLASQRALRRVRMPASRPAAKPASRPAAKPASRPAAKPASRPGARPNR
jgi:hypothetical protein